MSYSRRNFLKTTAVGAAAVGAAAAVPTALAGDADAATPNAPAHAGPFMAWVKDARTGEIAVLVGDQEVVHHDKSLARRLAQIAATARQA
jgi:anaerobic selenocysteine-containing dehydrogenase